MDDPTLSVTELNTAIRNALRGAVPGDFWVRGEVQGMRTSQAGHVYFQLVEKDERRNRIQAAMDVALFRNHQMTVKAELRKVAGVTLADDVEVRIKAHVDVYPTTGRLQLIMTGIDPVFTAGKLAADRERVLRTLQAEGLLRRNGARELVPVPLRIGLVTSAGSAAYHDFVHELERSGFAWEVGLCDVRVQGDNAPRRVVWALRRLARVASQLDAVVIVRGGGSRSDLAPFDAEAVAREIADMPVPVFTGIGHEIDRTVADEVSHTSCKTPTACAQSLVEHVAEYVGRVDVLSRGIAHRARARCTIAQRELLTSVRRAHRGAPRAVLRELAVLGRHRGRAEELGSRAVRDAAIRLDDRRAVVAVSAARLSRGQELRIGALADRLRALDPTRVLERGYSITRDASGRTIRRAASLQPGDRLVTEFVEGSVRSTVDAGDTEPS